MSNLCNPMDCNMPGLPVPHHLLEFAQVHVHCISDAIPPSHPLTPSSPPALNLSQHQGLFQWVISSHQMTKILEPQTKYWNFSISPPSEYSGLISLKINWFELLALQGTFRSLLQHHSSKASIFWHSAFMVQFSQPYVTTGKTIALTTWTLISRVMSPLFNILSRFVITFLTRSNHLLFHASSHHPQSFWSPRRGNLPPITTSTLFPSICHVVMGPVGFPGGSISKESAYNEGELGSIPGLGRLPGGGHGNPLQSSCLENPHGQRRLAGYSPWSHKELDTAEWLRTKAPNAWS